ncbi:MAG TPA: NUDIX domain-containing protein [Aquaticitalea sp.]|nr:NUDIX domain-containing protein [Aquaticitalea sp.]
MAEELIDILTEEGKPTGLNVPKSEIHTKGHYHNTVHIWFYTRNQEILLAQRAAAKLICPLLWDVSVAGHVDSGETIESAAIREIEEEIGFKLQAKDLQKIGVFECFQTYVNGIIDNEFHHTFLAEMKVDIHQLLPEPDEVENLKLVNFKEFESILDSIGVQNHLVPSNKSYYLQVFEAIEKQLS